MEMEIMNLYNVYLDKCKRPSNISNWINYECFYTISGVIALIKMENVFLEKVPTMNTLEPRWSVVSSAVPYSKFPYTTKSNSQNVLAWRLCSANWWLLSTRNWRPDAWTTDRTILFNALVTNACVLIVITALLLEVQLHIAQLIDSIHLNAVSVNFGIQKWIDLHRFLYSI